MADSRATVFGGSGFIGRHLAAQLVTSGLKVRVAVRHVDRTSDQPVEAVAGDVLDDSSVASAVQGASAVINLVGILSESGRRQTMPRRDDLLRIGLLSGPLRTCR